ncbi:MAG: hypothetical protein PHV00_07800, partial [Syntrophales bacterium]|nr:hypothetical protein [Syntrophales bacterium]
PLSPPANRSENRSVYQSRSRGWVIFTLPQPLQVGQFSVTTISPSTSASLDLVAKGDKSTQWGNIDVNEITPAMVMKHLETRARKVSDNSWNRDLKNLLAMFNFFRKIHGVTHNPVINIDWPPKVRKAGYIPSAEYIHRVSIKKLQRLLRHQTQATTEIYLKKIDDDLSIGLRLLEKKDTQRDTQAKNGFASNG